MYHPKGGVLVVSTAKISKYLKGMHFPADKQQVMTYAREHDAPDDVMGALKSMSDSQFDSMAGVWHAVGHKGH
jgi:hypothetical protein